MSGSITVKQSFDGIGQGIAGPSGTHNVQWVPPDTNGAVGPSNYVQVVNTSIEMFAKDGTPLLGPEDTNTLFAGFGGLCETTNQGDAVVRYDRSADRWVVTQFAFDNDNGPFEECVAVSTSSDPTGSWYRYSFGYANFPDYPKLSVWPDGYYVTYNFFAAADAGYVDSQVCAWDRSAMLVGATASEQCFETANGSPLAADDEGSARPPAGEPEHVVSIESTSSLSWEDLTIDWLTPANSTLTTSSLAIDPFTYLCSLCVQQKGTTTRLDALEDRLMYHFVYRRLADHEALVVSHTVAAGASSGVRWYEIRLDGVGSPSVYQQGTYAPDANYRWMGSATINDNGDIAIGYSASSSTLYPSIRVAARTAADPLGTLPYGEASIIDGFAPQLKSFNRWGDYSSIDVDPSDDCTFWYTNQYQAFKGGFNWRTRIGSFALPGCGTAGSAPAVSVGDASIVEADALTQTLKVPVVIASPVTAAVTVHFTMHDGTAAAGSDYQSKTGMVTLKAGAVSTAVPIKIFSNTADEGDRAFQLELTSVSGGGATLGRATGDITIIDNDPSAGPSVSIGDLAIREGDAGRTTLFVPVTLSSTLGSPTVISYTTADGAAYAPSDYLAATHTVKIGAGKTVAYIKITVERNIQSEPDETFSVLLTNAGGVTIARSTGTVTLSNDD